MLVNLKIPDETYEVYARRNSENPRVELERSLQAFAQLDPRKVSLILNQEELAELGTILGMQISDVKTLLELLHRAQRVSFGEGIQLALGVGQRARLKAMADFYKEPLEAYATRKLKEGVVAVIGA